MQAMEVQMKYTVLKEVHLCFENYGSLPWTNLEVQLCSHEVIVCSNIL